MSFQSFVTDRLAELTAKFNAIATNAKKIDELAVQNSLDPASKIHVSRGGISESLSVQKIIDAVSSGSYDKLLAIGEITLVDNLATIPANAQWKIADVNYGNIAAIEIPIPYCVTGLSRKDILVANTLNEIILVQGPETAGSIVIAPNIPINTIFITEMDVTDSTVGTPITPIVTDDYILKQESNDFIVSYYDAVIEQVDLPDHRASLNFMGTNTDVKSIALSGEFMRNGKIFTFKNHNATPLTIWHNSGTGNVKMMFSNEENFVLQPNEVIQFSLNYYDTSIPRLEYIGIITDISAKVDKVDGYSLTKNNLTDLLKTTYDNTVNWISTNGTNLLNHLSRTDNPHNVTAAQVGAPSGSGNSTGTNTGDETASTIITKIGDGTKINQSYLPSYVDDILEFSDLANFPATGESGKIYVAIDSSKQYRWTGSAYLQITNGLIGSTSDVPEGLNLYFQTARVLATLLTGISFVTGGAIVSTDSVLVAFGKIQKQINDNLTAIGLKQDTLVPGVNIKTINGQSILGTGDYEITSSSKLPFTAFVNPSLGNNTTAVLEDFSKPFQSIDGVFARYTSDQPTSSFVRIYLVNAGNYAWTQKIYSISFEIYSDKEVTVNLSTSTVVGSLFYNTSLAGYSTYFNFPLGTLYCSGSSTVNFNHERRSLLLNVKAIYWNASPQYGFILGFSYGVTVQNLSELSINARLFSDITVCKTPINLSVLNTLGANAQILCKNGITVGVINMSGTVNNLFVGGETWNIGDVNGVILFSYTHNNTIKINFNNSTISGGIKFENENGNLTFSGYIKSVAISGVTNTTSARRSVLNLVNLTIEDLKSDGFYFYDSFATVNILNCYIYQSVGTYLIKSLGRTSTAVKFTLKVEKTVYRQLNSGTLIYLDNNNNLENINIGGFESNCISISNIANTPSTFDLLSFKDKKKEIVIRSKIDLIGRVLSSTTTYIIDGTLTLLSGEYIEVPLGGLTIAGYGFDVSIITKNVSGQSIFTSPVGGSGNFVTNNIQYNSGLGSVFNLLDSDGSHAIELNDVNFQSCASLGILEHYRQFTGTTCGIYGCSDGITLEGAWNGFKLVNTNAFGFGASGTLIKKGTTTSFSNRLYLDLNLSLPTGAKICDFQDSNFASNKLLQIVNCLVKINGVIDPETTGATFPNITPFSLKSYFTNNIGVKNSFNEPYGLKTTNLLTYSNDASASSGGIQIGEVYIETTTGYFKTRLT